MKSIFCMIILMILLFNFLPGMAQTLPQTSDISLKLRDKDDTGRLCDAFYPPKDTDLKGYDLSTYWQDLSEGHGNFIWYCFFKITRDKGFYYYPKVIAAIPQDWQWHDKSLRENGGGSFSCLYSSNALHKIFMNPFYGGDMARVYINVEIKEIMSKQDLKKIQQNYPVPSYTRAAKTVCGLQGDKFTKYEKNFLPSTDVESVIYLLHNDNYIYKISLEKQYDTRYTFNAVPIDKEVTGIMDSICILEK